MQKNPKVSIIIPVYNGSNYLAEAIDSALAQTYQNIEVIVINDGSKDNGATESIAKSYKDKIRYFHKSNGGVSTALNLGIEKMTGEYFSWLSHDDMYVKEKVAKEVKYILTLKAKKSIVFSNFTLINETGKVIQKVIVPDIEIKEIPSSMIYASPISGCTLLIPKQAFSDIGPFDPKLKTTQDYDMWFRMATKYKFHHIKDSLVLSRVHSGQGTLSQSELRIEEQEKLYSNYVAKYARELGPEILYKISMGLLDKECFKSSRKAFWLIKSADSISRLDKIRYFKKYALLKAVSTKRGLFSKINKFSR